MDGRWLRCRCFVGCCFSDLFNTARNILVNLLSIFFSIRLLSVHVVHQYSSIDTTAALKKTAFYMNSGFKKSYPSLKNGLLNWIDALTTQKYPNGWLWGKLSRKDPEKEPSYHYRPITCKTRMWKILTAQTKEKIYYFLLSCRLFREEQKWFKKVRKGTTDLLYIDILFLKENKARRTNVAMVWIDYNKAYYVILRMSKMYTISNKVKNFITEVMGTRKWN